jgi:hypothetical protein
MHRLSYVEFFAAELYHIPTFRPFQDGAITADAVLRPLMPRILFPEKEGIDDTARTRQLSGVHLPVQVGASISIGYIGEFYADFGIPGMFAPLLVLGWLYGRTFRWLMNGRNFAGPLGMGLACAVLMQLGGLDNSFTKIFGELVVSSLACWAIAQLVIRRCCPWILLDAQLGLVGTLHEDLTCRSDLPPSRPLWRTHRFGARALQGAGGARARRACLHNKR